MSTISVLPTIDSINPFNNKLNAKFDILNENQIIDKIELANNAFNVWKNVAISKRGRLLHRLSEVLLENKEELALLSVMEMGMTYVNAISDINKSVASILWYINNSELILKDKEFNNKGMSGKIVFEPLGVIYSVAPWNFPYNQVFRNAVPNIIAGNVVLNKHASNVPMIAKRIEELFLQSGFEKGIFTNLFISSKDSELIISNKFVRGANVTGGELAGRTIGHLSGKYLIPSVLELGGSDAFVVLDNNNLDKIVDDAINARLGNGGQKCNSAKRFIVLDKYYDDFCKKMTTKMNSIKYGDPMDEDNVFGPLAKRSLVDELESQINDSINLGAKLLTGGKSVSEDSNMFPPTVLMDVKPGMRVFDEEVFGPVAPIIKVRNIAEAISFANFSTFGLGCSLYGSDIEELKRISTKINVGNVFINKIVTSYPFLPYGGVKNSGYGKELGERGLKNFVNEKVIVY